MTCWNGNGEFRVFMLWGSLETGDSVGRGRERKRVGVEE